MLMTGDQQLRPVWNTWIERRAASLFLARTSIAVAFAVRCSSCASKADAMLIDIGNEVAGPALTSPLRHSVPHWYGLMPSRSIAGVGEFSDAPPWLIWPTFSASVSRDTRSSTRSVHEREGSQNGKEGVAAAASGSSESVMDVCMEAVGVAAREALLLGPCALLCSEREQDQTRVRVGSPRANLITTPQWFHPEMMLDVIWNGSEEHPVVRV